MDISETKKAYISGFFDGEGSIGIGGPGNNQVIVRLGQNIIDPLEEIRSIYGGTITEDKRGKYIGYQWKITSRNAKEFLQDILPHSIIKKKQIQIGLDFIETIGKSKNNPLSQKDRRYRADLVSNISRLKTSDYTKTA